MLGRFKGSHSRLTAQRAIAVMKTGRSFPWGASVTESDQKKRALDKRELFFFDINQVLLQVEHLDYLAIISCNKSGEIDSRTDGLAIHILAIPHHIIPS